MSDVAATMSAAPWSAIGVRLLELRVLQERKDSAIAEARIDDGSAVRDIIVKQHRVASRDGRSPAELAQHEFATLMTLARSLAPGSRDVVYTTPRALLIDAPRAIVAMERAAGTPLDRIISAARRRGASRRLARPLARAAGWLRAMQQQTRRPGDGRLLLDAAVDSALTALARNGDPAVVKKRAALERRLRGLAARVDARSLHVSGQHGDFWPGNIFLSEQRVEVIDFEGFRDGLPLQDVVYLLGYLEQLPLALVDYGLLSRFVLDAWLAGERLDVNAFALLRLVHAIESLDHGMTGGAPLLRWLRRTSHQIVLSA